MVAIGLSLACLAVIGVAGLALFSRHVGRKVEAALPPLGRFLDLGDTRIHYLDEGAGPPVLLVHGLGGQMRNFTPLRQALQQQGFRTIAIDRPGSGYSTRPSDAPATPMAQARIVAEVVRWLGLEQPLILGHSLGGAVALAVALDFPDAVGGLVLLAPLTQPQAGVPVPFRRLAIRSPLLRRLVACTLAVPLGIAKGRATLQVVFAPERPPGDFPVTGGGLLSLRPKAFQAASTDLIAANEAMGMLAERYATLRLPVGVLFGTADQILDPDRQALPLGDQIASVELELIDGAGHMLPITRIDAVVSLVRRILARVEAGRPAGRHDGDRSPSSRAGNDAMTSHFDVLIIGAGLSGIGAACHLQKHCPGKSFAILEARGAMGGTWDLFRYPGVRSDSDMFTLGYGFRPWREPKAIADGASILRYIRGTAEAHGVEKRIRYHHKVRSAAWSSTDAAWTLEVEHAGVVERLSCRFLFTCTGYYDYAGGYAPAFPGREHFQGQVIHPQQWPEGLDYSGKRVTIIGSGATAITLAPAMAATAAHVTMLQRSPTYVVSRPAEDPVANLLRRKLPARLAYRLIRWRNILMGMFFYNLARKRPERTKERILGWVRRQLGPDYDVATHFTPRYNPWDQRLCLVPDADLFRAIRAGSVSVTTDEIASFTETGIRLKSGTEIASDIIVTATGLQLQLLSGMRVTVDGTAVDLAKTLTYKGMMYGGVPNLASAFGYTNASWTLKCDLSSEYVCRLIAHMDRHGYAKCVPVAGPSVGHKPLLDFTSSYVQRGIGQFPGQGAQVPWKVRQNYLLDLIDIRFRPIDDGVMRFSRAEAPLGAAD